MRIVTLVARLLLALIFVVFGLNGLTFIDMVLTPSGLAGQFMVPSQTLIIFGLLLRYSLLVCAVAFGPVIVNIFLYRVFLNPSGMLMAMVVVILWLIVFYEHRQHFTGIFVQRT